MEEKSCAIKFSAASQETRKAKPNRPTRAMTKPTGIFRNMRATRTMNP